MADSTEYEPLVEYELKFRIAPERDLDALLARCRFVRSEAQSDEYFQHPCRDFAQTDEALRIRTIGDGRWVTYKGARFRRDVKARREIEFPLVEQTAAAFRATLLALGFRSVAVVSKQRHVYLLGDEEETEIVVDDVEGLGRFIEIEVVAPSSQADAASDRLVTLARSWGLEHPERRSYLELVLEASGDETPSDERG